MKHSLPEDLTTLSRDELNQLLADLTSDWSELVTLSDDEITDEQLVELEEIGAAIDTVQEQVSAVEAAEAQRAERLAAIRSRQLPADGNEGGEESEDEEDVEDEEPEEGEEPADREAEKEPVMASAKPQKPAAKRSVVSRMHADTDPAPKQEAARPKTAIVAAADVPGLASGATIADFAELSKAYASRAKGFAPSQAQIAKAEANPERWAREHRNAGLRRFGLAQIVKPKNEFELSMGMSVEKQLEIIDRLVDESRLPGGSLVAAGGWCAPSETIYDFGPVFETTDGMFSIPEVNISRGGINFSTGPSYSSIAAAWGFLQTEAQAEAGTEKVCFTVDCPAFTDHRLDAIGFCIQAGILTNVGYPELIQRILQIGAVAHQHKVNRETISRTAALAGTAVDWTEIGAGAADLLNGIDVIAEWLRYSLVTGIGSTMEIVLPAWARLIARQDIAVRNGGTPADAFKISDADVQAYFSARGLAVQWVYDWQDTVMAGAAAPTAMPTSVNALIYPAGTFFKGTTPVIDLDAVYDSVGLSTNTYNAAFFEEGLLVAQRGGKAAQVTIGLNYKGATGYPSIGAGAGVTYAAV